ncbi:MAG TPA: response regulator [Terriglobales bacterium]|nr:response regulator [Terriglobales bacterium]
MNSSNPQSTARILCVDDEPVGLTVRKLLLERRGYTVETASNGTTALDLFKTRPFDLVLLDFYMPAMNGAEVARAMRQIRPDARIVMLSAYVSLPEEALQHVNASLTKGIHPEVLLDSISQIISANRTGD